MKKALKNEGAVAGAWFVTTAPMGNGEKTQVLLNDSGDISGMLCRPALVCTAMVALLDAAGIE